MPVIIEFSRCVGTYLSAKFKIIRINPCTDFVLPKSEKEKRIIKILTLDEQTVYDTLKENQGCS